MQEIKLLIIEEDEMVNCQLKGGSRPIWEANHAVIRKKDGTCEVIKDRWSYPTNTNRITVCLPYLPPLGDK